MKKIITISILLLIAISCKKEEIKTSQTKTTNPFADPARKWCWTCYEAVWQNDGYYPVQSTKDTFCDSVKYLYYKTPMSGKPRYICYKD